MKTSKVLVVIFSVLIFVLIIRFIGLNELIEILKNFKLVYIPIIILIGTTPIDVTQGNVYVDDGATASDNIDGDLTANITIVNNVNTSIIGNYIITYNVQDSSGNNAIQVVRNVNVISGNNSNPPSNLPPSISIKPTKIKLTPFFIKENGEKYYCKEPSVFEVPNPIPVK